MTVKRFEILSKEFFGNDPGDIVRVEFEDDDNLYYTDGFGRSCYVEKSTKGKDWKWAGKFEEDIKLVMGDNSREYLDTELEDVARDIKSWIDKQQDDGKFKFKIILEVVE